MHLKKTRVTALASLLALGACGDLTVPNLNDPSAGSAATRSSVLVNAQGMMAEARTLSVQGVRTFGIWGRESYDLRPQEPRPYTDNLVGPRDPNSFGNSYFADNYTAIANSRSLLASVDVVDGLNETEKEAIRGWSKTIEAYAYFQLAVHHPEDGAPLEPPTDPTGDLADIVPAEQLYERALSLFDEAAAHLQAGGAAFPFQLTAGYAPFDTPVEFVKVNRALKARTLKYMGRWDDALTALQGSFVDPAAAMDLGVWHTYDPNDGTGNGFYNVPTDYIHPRIRGEAQTQPDGRLDARALAKTATIDPVTVFGVTVTETPAMYASPAAPFPLIKNEELLLIRAEANLARGNTAAALADVNVVRTRSGGLAPLASAPGAEALLDEILYNKLYSLLWEGGFTYLDAYQYGRLDELPRALPEHVVFTRLNYPANECLARGLTSGACGSVVGQ